MDSSDTPASMLLVQAFHLLFALSFCKPPSMAWRAVDVLPLHLGFGCQICTFPLHLQATFYGMDSSDVPAAAGSVEECAQRCDETEGCDLWSYCPEDAADG